MSGNLLTDLKTLIVEKTPRNTIVEVISYDPTTGAVNYKSRAGTSTFISEVAYTPRDLLILNGDNVLGLAEDLTNTVWIS